jgi:hypothetical protein
MAVFVMFMSGDPQLSFLSFLFDAPIRARGNVGLQAFPAYRVDSIRPEMRPKGQRLVSESAPICAPPFSLRKKMRRARWKRNDLFCSGMIA